MITVVKLGISAETLRQAGLYFKWSNFALIYDKQAPYEAVATALREASDEKNYIIKSTHYVTTETKNTDVQEMLQQIRKFARGSVMWFIVYITNFCMVLVS